MCVLCEHHHASVHVCTGTCTYYACTVHVQSCMLTCTVLLAICLRLNVAFTRHRLQSSAKNWLVCVHPWRGQRRLTDHWSKQLKREVTGSRSRCSKMPSYRTCSRYCVVPLDEKCNIYYIVYTSEQGLVTMYVLVEMVAKLIFAKCLTSLECGKPTHLQQKLHNVPIQCNNKPMACTCTFITFRTLYM